MVWHPPVLDALQAPATVSLIVINCFVCYKLVSGNVSPSEVGNSPVQVLDKGEYWRIITSAFSHFSLMHIVFNMASLWSLMQLEMVLGVSYYLIYITILVIFSALTDCIIRKKFMADSNPYSIGFSAVLFGLETIVATFSSYMNFLGFTIPWSIMPFISCITIAILIPDSSFVGHLSGIIIGYLIRWHLFDWITPKLYYCMLPWLIVFFGINYKKSHRDSWKWLEISKNKSPPRTHMEGGVIVRD